MGRKRDDSKVRAVGECPDSGFTVRAISELLGIPLGTVKQYAWAHGNPKGFLAWRQRHAERQRANNRRRAERQPRNIGFWNLERLGQLKDMLSEGKSYAECAHVLGCTRNSVAGICWRAGFSSPLEKRKVGNAMELVKDGMSRGLSTAEISSRYGIPSGTVQSYSWRLRNPEKAERWAERWRRGRRTSNRKLVSDV